MVLLQAENLNTIEIEENAASQFQNYNKKHVK